MDRRALCTNCGFTSTYVGVSMLPKTTGALVAAVCHVQFNSSHPPSSDSTTQSCHVTIHTQVTSISSPDPVVARRSRGICSSRSAQDDAGEF